MTTEKRKRTGQIVLGWLLIWACSVAQAESSGISISQSVDKTEAAYEDSVRFEIKLSWSGPQSAYRFDKPLNPVFDGFKVRGFSSSISSVGSKSDERTIKRFVYNLEPNASGLTTIPAIVIDYLVWPDSIPGELVTEVMAVTVAEPRPVEEADIGWSTVTLVVVVSGILLVVVVVVLLVVRRRQPAQVTKSPKDAFLEDLTRLKAESGTDLKKLQTGLFRLLVIYLSAEFRLDLANKTSDEIGVLMEDTTLSLAQREKIMGWLVRAEKEKYSPVAAAPGEALRIESEVRTFFENM